ncbi:hypothetical protein CEXT_425621 [Caerostris extrusa]|uniref:Uncharacterized protein n=1 Tax=Caerostris extrusa TaxID=172846 RepID=A0AAV4XXC5_CAEEX|nr:hypothetical protein CEXT_425621 [Caerostris extrusa]
MGGRIPSDHKQFQELVNHYQQHKKGVIWKAWDDDLLSNPITKKTCEVIDGIRIVTVIVECLLLSTKLPNKGICSGYLYFNR